MITTTLEEIKKHNPCKDGWEKLLKSLNKTEADATIVTMEHVLNSNGISDAVWALRACNTIKAQELSMVFASACGHELCQLLTQHFIFLEAVEKAQQYLKGEVTLNRYDLYELIKDLESQASNANDKIINISLSGLSRALEACWNIQKSGYLACMAYNFLLDATAMHDKRQSFMNMFRVRDRLAERFKSLFCTKNEVNQTASAVASNASATDVDDPRFTSAIRARRANKLNPVDYVQSLIDDIEALKKIAGNGKPTTAGYYRIHWFIAENHLPDDIRYKILLKRFAEPGIIYENVYLAMDGEKNQYWTRSTKCPTCNGHGKSERWPVDPMDQWTYDV